MKLSLLFVALAGAYAVACVAYVYQVRGSARYPGLSQYLRKSWPVFAPLNCLLYMATSNFARQPVISGDYLEDIEVIRQNWKVIRAEALALHAAGGLDSTSRPGSAGYYDLGFRTFYKRGWKKFYLKWYGQPHASAQRLCPETVRLLQQTPSIKAAMFSVLPGKSELTLHSDPLACSLRYHLGLETPNSDQCFINVDGVKVAWRDGQDFVFDESYPHFAKNETSSRRLILMCDVERPMNPVGRCINYFYSMVAKGLTVPNTNEDRRGALSALFAAVSPWRERALILKESRRSTYVLLKLTLNSSLVALSVLPVYGLAKLLEHGFLLLM